MITRQYLIRATALGETVRAFAVDATTMVAELQRRHQTAPAVTAALGRVAMGALLLGAMLKDDDHLVTLRVQGDGPAGTLLASANASGGVRATVANPRPDAPQVRDGKLDVSGVVGTKGRLTVTRDLGLRQPYTSMVELVSGEIGEDLAHFFLRSEQIPSAVGIGVFLDGEGEVRAAGGYLVQMMPGSTDAHAAAVEAAVRAMPHPTAMLRAGDTPERILDRIFDTEWKENGRTDVGFHCPCSRDRAERALVLLGSVELVSVREQQTTSGCVEMHCEFCRSRYEFNMAEIDVLIRAAT